MPTHRNPRRRPKRARLTTAYRDPFAAGIPLSVNPNRGKRDASSLAFMDGFIAELARESERELTPVTVFHKGYRKRKLRELPTALDRRSIRP